ncbi:PTS sugar transporter subunit IIA [Allonocardiopsis opalescens]|uniref:PTS system N-acetylgalactosamine-specific IIA component/PTS system mannose-specific IIA component n=1 Tax=Allonocardiopsis opalescens TaxID=1144618 RepID=A0A2T0Q2W7_9ACTN|nr:PTS sugar transporter subunit IIA [Allonocardiopsis opalescens]PRX98133.1 PTS system N-acetylgalactosamine-specific IIA component/PTS system mannose-specific IIA component [Allonocardiopsis opalescens]
MVAVVVAGHGRSASGLLSAVEVIVGPQQASAALDLEEGEAPEGFGARLRETAAALDGGEGVLVLADLPGATPFTSAARLTRELPGLAVVAGVNVPMLLEVLTRRAGTALAELAELAEGAGRQGVVRWSAG